METNFDKVAKWYDRLAYLVFGSSIKRAQIYFLNKIPTGSTILILGGGTGWIINEVFRHTMDCKICYIDSSAEMILRSKENYKGHSVQFIKGTEANIPRGLKFDVVITNFYLDLFSDQDLLQVIKLIHKSLAINAKWIVTDFVCLNGVHRFFLWMMYRFFRVMCGIGAKSLPAWEESMPLGGFYEQASNNYFHRFIRTVFYHSEMME